MRPSPPPRHLIIISELAALGKREVLRELSAEAVGRISSLNVEKLCADLEAREDLGSTGIGDGVAIPHAKVPGLTEVVVILGRSSKGINFGARDGRPVHLFLALLTPAASSTPYLKLLADNVRFLEDPKVRSRLLQAENHKELEDILRELTPCSGAE